MRLASEVQTTAEHDVVWSIWAGDHGELSCAHLNGECQFHAKSHELIGAFLACPPDWAQGPPLRRTWSTAAWLPDNCTRLADSLQQTIDALCPCNVFDVIVSYLNQYIVTTSKFPTLHLLCIMLLWQIEIFNQNRTFLLNFHDFNFLLIFRSWHFSKVK